MVTINSSFFKPAYFFPAAREYKEKVRAKKRLVTV
jgi:hypothetical protein